MRRFLIPAVLALAGCGKPETTATTKAETKHSEARQDDIVVIPPPAVVRTGQKGEVIVIERGSVVTIWFDPEVPPPPTRKLPLPSQPVVPPIPPSGPPVVPPFPPSSPPVHPLPLPGGPVMLPGGPSLPVPGR